jgi:hypothetical protein
VEDLLSKGSGWLIRLHEKGCHAITLSPALHAYIAAAGTGAERKRATMDISARAFSISLNVPPPELIGGKCGFKVS